MAPTDLARRAYRTLRRRTRPDLPRLSFLHLPKCGGTSLNAALNAHYVRAGYETVGLDAHASKKAADAVGETLQDFRSDLYLYYLARERLRYLSGHFTFSELAWDVADGRWAFLTMLRDPVARWYSAYFYGRYKTHSDHFRITRPLAEHAEHQWARGPQSMYARFLGVAGEGQVGRAIATLERFDLVGVLEESETLVRECERVLGVGLSLERKNASPRSAEEQQDEVTPEIDRLVREIVEPDRRIYDAVRERIARRGTWRDR